MIEFSADEEAYIEANHPRSADPDGYDAWREQLAEEEAQERARARVQGPPKKMRAYR